MEIKDKLQKVCEAFRIEGKLVGYEQIKAGNVDRVYICRMREIGGNEHQLFGFFKCAMDHGVKVRTLEYSLPARLQQYELGEKIENYAAKHYRPMPWVV